MLVCFSTLDSHRLYKLLRECGVEIILIDEFHHIIDGESDKILYTVSDWLKQLINETKLPIVLIGLPHSIKILQTNSQLKRRFSMRDELKDFEWIELPKFNQASKTSSINNEESISTNDFRVFLKVLDSLLPLAETSHLADHSIAFRMWNATNGNVNRTMKLVRYAAKSALIDGGETITLEYLKQAFAMLFADDASDNPFVQ